MAQSVVNGPELRILELYSGIGGMHFAFKESGLAGDIVAAMDINTLANTVYRHNFPTIKCLNRNIQSLTPQHIEELNVNCILMSPPCQPFTRNGNKKDTEDLRTNSFLHILNILKELSGINHILLENVNGFQESDTRNLMVSTLNDCHFNVREFLITPTNLGIPNSRLRYYCIAQRQLPGAPVENEPIRDTIPGVEPQACCFKISTILEQSDHTQLLLPDNLLQRRAWLLDICNPDDNRSICFTKAYSHFVEGTGSVFTEKPKPVIEQVFKEAHELKEDPEKMLRCLKQLDLRYFSPREVARLMSFPTSFTFPQEITRKQRYRLLGNSINVKVVSTLIPLLVNRRGI